MYITANAAAPSCLFSGVRGPGSVRPARNKISKLPLFAYPAKVSAFVTPCVCGWGTAHGYFALNLSYRPVQLPGDHLFLIIGQQGVPLAQISIDHPLDRRVISPIDEMVSTRQWRVFTP